MPPLIGWVVGWPNRPEDEQDGDNLRDHHGYGVIVAVHGEQAITRVVDDMFKDEPPYHISVCLHDEDLRFFPNERAYLAWIEYWRSRPDAEPATPNLLHLVPRGRG